MVINNLDSGWSSFGPDKADAVLFIDTDAMLSGSITSKGFEPIPRRHAQLF
jgi:hypothetical protein